MRRELTQAELRAYAEAAKSIRKLRCVQRRAEIQRQRGRRDTATAKGAANV